jgi:hypothetical protein
VVVENSTRHEASLAGSADRFDWADIYVGNKNKYGVHVIGGQGKGVVVGEAAFLGNFLCGLQ